jgi:hypothetical protein
MSQPDTLFDLLYKASYRSKTNPGWTDNERWRVLFKVARRFVIDDAMSTFMGELATHAFVRPRLSPEACTRTIEHLRMGARLPSAVTWIEYNLRNALSRGHELTGTPYDPAQSPSREGWLLQRHPTVETAFIAHFVSQETIPGVDYGDGYNVWTFPLAFGWTVDADTVLPWHPIKLDVTHHNTTPKGLKLDLSRIDPTATHQPLMGSAVICGIKGYLTTQANYVRSPLIVETPMSQTLYNLLLEWSGTGRRLWALLSTINDLPVEIKEVRASKGFVGKGAYRKFLDHKTVTLTVPVKLYRKTARDALAIAHRRGGPVREHWRKDWRRPLSVLCDHVWSADAKHMFCTLCEGRKIWINEHVRGDTSVGFVTRDFNVTHDPKATTP